MLDILVRAGSFVFIILLGYGLKRIGFFKEADFTLLSRITIRITLSAAIICNLASVQIEPSLLSLALLGIGGGILYIALGILTNLGKDKERKAFDLLNLTGYNIGCFTMPFAQSFLGPMGVLTCSLFDMGNSVICLGGAVSIASMVKSGSGFSWKRILRSLLSSAPFICYLVMLFLNMVGLRLPEPVVSCAQMISNANAFMAMLTIGVGFKLGGEISQIGRLGKLLVIRYTLAAALALVYYFVLPFPLEVRQALVILAFSPIGSVMPGFTGEMGGDVGLSSALNSISILISIVIIMAVLSVML